MVATKSPLKSPSKNLKAGNKKSINKWIVLAGVAAIAIIGVVVVRYSSASTATTFSYSCANGRLYGNDNRKVSKSGSGCSYAVSAGHFLYTVVPNATMAATRRVCAQVAFTSSNTRVVIQVAGARNYGSVTRDVGGGVVCTTDLISGADSVSAYSGIRTVAGYKSIDVYVASGTATISRIDGTPSSSNAY